MVTGRFRAAPGPIIERFFGGKDCFLVQVGANDGVYVDPLHKLIKSNPRWRGMFIEPLDEAFEQLLATYRDENRRFIFEQTAIAESDEDRMFYYFSLETIRREGWPDAANGVSSFSYAHVFGHVNKLRSTLTRAPEEYVSARRVRCQPLMSVLDRHSVNHIDVFVVDAETYDYCILKQLNFERLCPKIILYEHSNLSESEKYAAIGLLLSQGYRLFPCGADTIAVRP
jgi:FkbM family methyltransferase